MRRDIQFLRGIAVLLVVIYHSGLGLLPHGYLGVDVFFVISGFLITKVILEGVGSQTFNFIEFYYRRAARLLPALYCTLLVTSILSVFFLTQNQLEEYLEQFFGAISFTANLILPGQVGYFEAASEGKPLLHIWSLSLEEQYYFFLPLILFISPAKFRLFCLIFLFLASILFCFLWVYIDSHNVPFGWLAWRYGNVTRYDWAFYLLPTRAWELLVGSLAAWIYLNSNFRFGTFSKVLALFSIFAFGIVALTNSHPSIEALIVVLATSTVLLGRDDWLPQDIITQCIRKVGDWSYSIYLVHWPLFAFAYLAYVGDVPTYISLFIVIVSIFLGRLQYVYVETPFRNKTTKPTFHNGKGVVCATCIMALIPILLWSHPLYDSDAIDFSEIRKVNHGLNQECEYSFFDTNHLKSECRNSDTIEVVVWGDSYAMHLASGLSKNTNLAQITMSVCGPFIDIAPVNGRYNREWAEACIDYNRRALEFIKKTPSVTTILVSSPLTQYLESDTYILSSDRLLESSVFVLQESYKRLIESLKAEQVEVIFVSPPPKNGLDVGECLERLFGPAIIFRDSCDITIPDYHENQKEVLKALKLFENYSKVVYLSDYLCDEKICQTSKDNIFIYRDEGHLSIDGSRYLMDQLDLKNL